MRGGLAVVAAAAVLVAATANGGEELSVPPEMQAAIFKKIFGYDRVLSVAAPRVRIAYAPEFAAAAKELARAFDTAGVPAEYAVLEQAHQLGATNVLYVLASAVPAPLRESCAKAKALSISSFPALAERGEVSVALKMKANGRPEIIVHMGRLGAESHELSASLLALARVIR